MIKVLQTKGKLQAEKYVIDSNGYFNKVSTDSLYLSGLLSKYTKFDVEPEVDDPVYKYWTLR